SGCHARHRAQPFLLSAADDGNACGDHGRAIRTIRGGLPARLPLQLRLTLQAGVRVHTYKKGGLSGRPLTAAYGGKLARVELDDQVRLHGDRIGHLVELGHAGVSHLIRAVRRDVIGNFTFRQALRFDHQCHFLGLVAEADHVAGHDLAAGDVALHTVNADVAVADELASRPHRGCELRAIDHHVEALLEQADQVLARVTLHPRSGLVGGLELLFGDVAVVTLELLLGTQLQAIVAHLALAALAVLARTVRTAVHRGRRTAPDVLAHAAVEFMLGALALRHASYPSTCCRCPDGSASTRHRTDGPIVHRGRRFTGVRGQLAREP